MAISYHPDFTAWVRQVDEALTRLGLPFDHGTLPPRDERGLPTEGSTRFWNEGSARAIGASYVHRPDAEEKHLIVATFMTSSAVQSPEHVKRTYYMTATGSAEAAAADFSSFLSGKDASAL